MRPGGVTRIFRRSTNPRSSTVFRPCTTLATTWAVSVTTIGAVGVSTGVGAAGLPFPPHDTSGTAATVSLAKNGACHLCVLVGSAQLCTAEVAQCKVRSRHQRRKTHRGLGLFSTASSCLPTTMPPIDTRDEHRHHRGRRFNIVSWYKKWAGVSMSNKIFKLMPHIDRVLCKRAACRSRGTFRAHPRPAWLWRRVKTGLHHPCRACHAGCRSTTVGRCWESHSKASCLRPRPISSRSCRTMCQRGATPSTISSRRSQIIRSAARTQQAAWIPR